MFFFSSTPSYSFRSLCLNQGSVEGVVPIKQKVYETYLQSVYASSSYLTSVAILVLQNFLADDELVSTSICIEILEDHIFQTC